MTGGRPGAPTADVLVVGYGPVGQVLANLLAARGRRVVVVERWPQPYPMPRAVSFDGEAARVLAAAGVGTLIAEFGESSGEYVWQTADGQTLLHTEVGERGWCRWPDSTSMYQPGLEAGLAAHGETLPTLSVHRGYEAVDLVEDGGGVELTAVGGGGDRLVVRAAWVVGCDGANSFVRSRIAPGTVDLGFSRDWLICDVVPHEPRRFRPNNLQVCDPARPRTSVSAGPGHRRWEFMRVPGDAPAEFCTAETAWRLLGLFDITPDNAELERFAVYTFQAGYARSWRAGRVLLAGDSAHLMPPFAGQGMSSGFRDAVALAWRLDLLLGGAADESLLDSYTTERRAHVQHAITLSLNLGRVICQVDPEEAAEIHEVLLAARELGRPTPGSRAAFHPLTDGFLHRSPAEAPTLAGELAPQGEVAAAGAVGLFDDVVGRGWVLLCAEEPGALLDAEGRAVLDGLGARVVHVVHVGGGPSGGADVVVADLDGVYLPFLARTGAVAALVRPDFYVYGAAADREGVSAVLAELSARLSTPVRSAARAGAAAGRAGRPSPP